MEVLKWKASIDNLVFLDDKGSKDICDHYTRIQINLLTLGKSLKSAVSREKIEKDELVGREDTVKILKYDLVTLYINNL